MLMKWKCLQQTLHNIVNLKIKHCVLISLLEVKLSYSVCYFEKAEVYNITTSSLW